ncbi:tRNA uridine 5-oxyacetic acid(34) methyltransferase CmoM [Vibrio salinus]|uniref:tRNA uridine 5-oxyacetic acid(34) methyltransferase CmoM n=1 Tax=Vibrio salinus TaxID=2899784 RepID=UPI001E296A8A|nr:tRNA uridine 5-oxyacetic acid(34) methyltransferase CmoM [Vibrio salinus]MCE0496277.1 tRNA uridine 5-oxyacetic acid(34) methyltransferase CmoM [Vibrio salinus]
MTEDRNFDDIAHKFVKNIYGSDKGEIRQIIVWEDFEQILQSFSNNCFPLSILDAGGGLAQLSQKLAKQGHDITLCDVSSEMLKLAEEDIKIKGLSEQFKFVHSPVQELDLNQYGNNDLILFHAVMEWLSEPELVLKQLLSFAKKGGIVSIMFYNQHGLLFKNAVCGNIPHVLNGMPYRKRFKLQPQKGLIPDDVYRWIEDSGFSIEGRSGIRSFADYIGNRKNMGEYSFDELLELERTYCRQEPFLSMGRYIHVWARKL